MYPGTHAKSQPHKPAFVMGQSGEIITYGQLDARSNRCAHLLRNLGLKPGDAIAIFMENHPRFFEIAWAAQRAGLYYTPVNSHLTTPELEYIVRDCGAQVLFTSEAKRELSAALPDGVPTHRICFGSAAPGFIAYETAVAKLPSTPIADEMEGTDMLYSSGTTGRPKGIKNPLPNRKIGTPPPMLLALMNGMYGASPDTVYLSPAPFYHASPLRFVMTILRLGATAILMERFEPEEALRLIDRYRVSLSQWVPTMFIRMLKLPPEVRARYDVSSQTAVLHAAAPCPVPVKEQMIEWWGPILEEFYAGTEGNGSTSIDSRAWLSHKGSVGRPLNCEIHVLDDDGRELPAGEIGTIYFGGGQSFEYHNAPEKTARSRHPKGWSTLGDVGYVDAEGYLYLTDRKADMIIRGGVNIYPQEAENVLILHPKVADVAVFGIPDEDFGQQVKAVVQPAEGVETGAELEAELIDYCQQHLAKMKCPQSVDFQAELPRQATGKLYKRLLKAPYWEGHSTTLV